MLLKTNQLLASNDNNEYVEDINILEEQIDKRIERYRLKQLRKKLVGLKPMPTKKKSA